MSRVRSVLRLAIVAFAAPWLLYLLTAALGYAALAVPRVSVTAAVAVGCLTFAIPAPLMLVAAALHGRGRHSVVNLRQASAGLAVGTVFNGLFCFVLAAAGAIPEPWKLIVGLPLGAVFSGAVLAAVWAGSFLWRRDQT